MSADRTRTEITERTLTRHEIEKALESKVFNREEELAMRMLYGISVKPDCRLEFRGGDNEELKIKLAMIEKAFLEELDESGSGVSVEHFTRDL